MTPTYTLFKNRTQLDTLAIVRFLHARGVPASRPVVCIERNHPAWVTSLPSIECSLGSRHVGMKACVRYWEALGGVGVGVGCLEQKARDFAVNNPGYKIC